MIAILAAAAAFSLTALIGKPLVRKLVGMGFARTAIVRKDEGYTAGHEAAPEFGGLLLLIGLIPAGLIAAVILLLIGDTGSGFAVGKAVALALGAVTMAAIGLIDDWRLAAGLDRMKPILRCVLIWCGGITFLLALEFSGSYSNIVLVPFFGSQTKLSGIWYLLMILGFGCGGDRQREVSGQSGSVSLILTLAAAAVCTFFGAQAENAFAFAAAGSILGLLLFVFPPEKLREGSSGRLMMSTLPIMITMLIGAPLFMLPAGIPFIFEAIYAIISVVRRAAGRAVFPATFSGWLMEKGLDGKSVSGLMTLLALIGAILTIVSAYLYL